MTLLTVERHYPKPKEVMDGGFTMVASSKAIFVLPMHTSVFLIALF